MVPPMLQANIMAAAHEGHLGREAMLRQMRETVWWPGMSRGIKEYGETCLGCVAAQGENMKPPMTEREVPERPWAEVSCNFEGPVDGGYYFHTSICNLLRWLEMEMVKSTSFAKLRMALDNSFAMLGVPDKVIHDNGPPYNGHEWEKYAREMGFKLKPFMLLHPQSNGIAQRFNAVLAQVVHTAFVE